MTFEILQAIVTLVRFCDRQENCKNCPIKEFCGKMPCDI